MATVHKTSASPNWLCYYTDRNGKRRTKSTLTRSKRQAASICAKIQSVEDQARTGNITEEKARRVIEKVVGEIMAESGAPIERKTVREHFTSWLKAFESEQREGTFIRYQGVVEEFLDFLGGKASRNLAALTAADVERYRDHLQGRVAPSTVNTYLKVIRVGLEKAVKQRVFETNPARLVDNLSTEDRHERRAFTLPEIKKLLAVCNDDWKTAVIVGIYTGLRLGDVQSLTWANLDLQQNELTIRTQKTGRVQILPLAKPLLRHIETLPAGDDPQAPLCPALQGKTVSWLSNQFYEVMACAGLVQSRGDHQKKEGKAGRSARRQLSPISFHALRHTATSLLKNAGVSDVVARDIIGHESEAVSRNYTHIETETKRAALDKLPDVTAPANTLKRS
ncbi:MAG: tyrosine-type recombinase/integrase [Limisphaerales bacterium]